MKDLPWTIGEFALLVSSAEIDANELARTALSTRSVGAITVVRQGIRLYADGKDTHGILSNLMVEFLRERASLTQWAAHQPV